MTSSYTILAADSGLGGLSVVQEIRATIPGQHYLYLCDNAYYPYGLRQEKDLLDHFLNVMRQAIEFYRPDLIVAACNTISTICLPGLRAMTKAPVVGVVPAIKPAAVLSKKRILGLLATPATLERDYTQQLIEDFAKDCKIIRVGSAELVQMAEEKLRGIPPDQAAISDILSPFFDCPSEQRPDVIVLACTHFPLLKQDLAAASPAGTKWVDSGPAIAERVKTLLEMASPASRFAGPDTAIVTESGDSSLGQAFKHFGFSNVKALSELEPTSNL